MPFFLQNCFDEKMAQKAFRLLKRYRAIGSAEPEFRCLLCADSSFLLDELILCTDQAVFYRPSRASGLNRYDFSSITAVTIEVVKTYPSVSLTISNGETSRLFVATKDAAQMADYIKDNLPRPAPSSSSAADEILKYKGLLDCGAITAAEFEAKKKQLLGI